VEERNMYKKILLCLLFLFPLLTFAQEGQQIITNDLGYGDKVWTLSVTGTSTTSVTVTKDADTNKRWVITDFSGGGTQNGYLKVLVNNTEKWRLYFPANGSVGQKVVIISGRGESVSVTVVLSSSGDCVVNVRGTEF